MRLKCLEGFVVDLTASFKKINVFNKMAYVLNSMLAVSHPTGQTGDSKCVQFTSKFISMILNDVSIHPDLDWF